MSKSTFFTGQPIFNQLLNYISRDDVNAISRDLSADRYYKTFKTYEHLVTMLYAIFNQCTSLREVITGMLAWDKRIQHLGLSSHPRRSTFADANECRTHEVFEKVYFKLLHRYRGFLPDSRKSSRKNNLYIFDSTSISLFKEILKGAGLSAADGKRKGGIKVHTLLRSGEDVPCMIRYSAAAANDKQFLKDIRLPAGSVIVFDRGYLDYKAYNQLAAEQVTWVTRLHARSVYQVQKDCEVSDYHRGKGVVSDQHIELGHDHHNNAIKVKSRLVVYRDPVSEKEFFFISNNTKVSPLSIAGYYKQRWQIETFFKRIKQNYPLQSFLGDNDNAIKIQIWCTLIADLLIKVIKKGTSSHMSYANITGLVRLHLMTYMRLDIFLKHPEKELLSRIRRQQKETNGLSLFPT